MEILVISERTHEEGKYNLSVICNIITKAINSYVNLPEMYF